MINIYLDQNITTRIHSFPKLESLRDALEKSFGKTVLVYYSSAHIDDITSKTTERTDYVIQDLNNISKYTRNLYMHIDKGKISVIQKSPHDLFNEKISDDQIDYSNIDELMKSIGEGIDSPEVSSLLDGSLDLLDSIPLPPDIIEGIKALSINLPDNGSLKDFINGFMGNQEPLMKTELYKEQRDVFQRRLDINPGGVVNSKNPFEDIEKKFFDLGGENAFKNSLEFQGSDFFPKEYSRALNHYVFLDMGGYNQDKIIVNHPKKRNETFTNTINDAKHTAFGSYCDYYITKDKFNSLKARETYKKLNMSTVVINPDIDMVQLNELIQKITINNA